MWHKYVFVQEYASTKTKECVFFNSKWPKYKSKQSFNPLKSNNKADFIAAYQNMARMNRITDKSCGNSMSYFDGVIIIRASVSV